MFVCITSTHIRYWHSRMAFQGHNRGLWASASRSKGMFGDGLGKFLMILLHSLCNYSHLFFTIWQIWAGQKRVWGGQICRQPPLKENPASEVTWYVSTFLCTLKRNFSWIRQKIKAIPPWPQMTFQMTAIITPSLPASCRIHTFPMVSRLACGTFSAKSKLDNRGTGNVKFVCLLGTTRVSLLGCTLFFCPPARLQEANEEHI